ncbi:MAG: hypothetical protein KDA50_13390 [Rhodobacteraceae bacterium]|nr:hypothetical protein [Paracoccaceae bacterium]
MRIALILTLLALAACASPQERCVRNATRELATVNRLIEETETNLARGYTYVVEPVPYRFGVSYCTGRVNHVHACGRHETEYRRRAVAIDGALEQRKLDTLRARQKDLLTKARPAIEACGVPVIGS